MTHEPTSSGGDWGHATTVLQENWGYPFSVREMTFINLLLMNTLARVGVTWPRWKGATYETVLDPSAHADLKRSDCWSAAG